MHDSKDAYDRWVNQEIVPAAETYADDFFAHLATSMDEKASELIASLETDEGRSWTHDLTVPLINAVIMWTMAAQCKLAAESWETIHKTGLNKHFTNGR